MCPLSSVLGAVLHAPVPEIVANDLSANSLSGLGDTMVSPPVRRVPRRP